MRMLSLLRHAKSSWDEPDLDDFDRPLNARGLRDAPRMGRYMRDQALIPDMVVCSSALRTRQTAALVLEAMGPLKAEVVYEEGLYEAGEAAILDRIHRVSDCVHHLLVIGHNPGLQDLLQRMSEDGGKDDPLGLRQKFPTGALAVLSLGDAGWSTVGAKRLGVQNEMTPKALPA